MISPSPKGANGASDRDARGRFRKGHPGGPGNPMAKRVGQLRAALIRAVTPDAVRKIIDSLVEAARNGDVPAAKLIFDRALGQPVQADYEERLGALERLLESYNHQRRGH